MRFLVIEVLILLVLLGYIVTFEGLTVFREFDEQTML